MKKKFKKFICYLFGHNPYDNNIFPDVRCKRCGGWYKRDNPSTVVYL